ncbi:membrane protein insertion efficiency factor YidD [Candidatus Peregrinibacteria bacterium]|nr:membrane protein insertion efficiency factor YidD [Candidatus Peregrinibacteria bacterium]
MASRNHQEITSKVILQNLFKAIWIAPRYLLIGLIVIYQKTLSPDHGLMKPLFPHGYCRFHPTCSEYGKMSLKKYGLLGGLPRLIWRVIRCNPWSAGGIDEP